jgi:urease accessory protein
MDKSSLLSLLQLSDPTLPIGGFSHSAGLETYAQLGLVKDLRTARTFVTEMLSRNIHYTDAAFVSFSYDAIGRNDFDKIKALDQECTAVKLPKEMRQASQKLGIRLIKIFSAICTNDFITKYDASIKAEECTAHYCISYGLYAFALGIEKQDALLAFYYNAAVGMVTNCVKLIPLGQHDGQQLLFSLHELVSDLATQSMHPNPDLTGLCCTGFDIRSMQHEQLYSRLYMS